MIKMEFYFKQLKTQNMMKKILQLIVVLLIATQGVMAQTVQIESVVEPPGDIQVQVDMLSFTAIGAVTLKIGFDSDLMDFTGIDNTTLDGNWFSNVSDDEIIITYTTSNLGTGDDINGKAFDLLFSYKGGFTSDLTFNSGCEIVGADLSAIDVTYIDGMVSNEAGVGTVSMDMLVEAPGATIDMPINIEGAGFGTVASMTYMIAFDEFKLTYVGVVEDALTGVIASASNGMLTINWTGAATDFSALTHLLDVQFAYNGGDADVVFAPGCEINDENLVALGVDYTNGEVTPAAGTASITVSSAVGESLEALSIPIMAADFGTDEMGAITLELTYDNSLMAFTGVTDGSLTGWVDNGNGSGEISLQWNDAGGSLVDGAIASLNFVFFETAGEAEIFFVAGSLVTDVDLQNYPVSFNSGEIVDTWTVSGQLTYFGDAARPMFSSTVYLKNDADDMVAYTTTTDASGNYTFTDVIAGSYYLDGATTIDATFAYDLTDAFVIFGIGGTFTGIQAQACDVNDDTSVDMTDAFIVYGSVLALNVKVPAWIADDWFFDNVAVTVSNAAVSQDFSAIASGDANGDFVPVP